MLCLQDPLPASSVVSEWVPQENEDKDDTGGCQRRTGDVKQPRCLGILYSSIQVIQELLVPNLETKGGREGEVRGGTGVDASRERERKREVGLRKEEGGRKEGDVRSQQRRRPTGKETVAIRGGGREADVRRGGRTESSRPRGAEETEEGRLKPIKEQCGDE